MCREHLDSIWVHEVCQVDREQQLTPVDVRSPRKHLRLEFRHVEVGFFLLELVDVLRLALQDARVCHQVISLEVVQGIAAFDRLFDSHGCVDNV